MAEYDVVMNEQLADVEVTQSGGEVVAGPMLWRAEDGIEGAGMGKLDDASEAGRLVARWQGEYEQYASIGKIGGSRKQKVGLFSSLFWGAVWPSRVTRREDCMCWWEVITLHLLGWISVGLALLGYGIYEQMMYHYRRTPMAMFADRLFGISATQSLADITLWEWLLLGGWIGLMEISGIAFCVLMSGWCARPGEGIWASIMRSIRRGMSITVFATSLLCTWVLFEFSIDFFFDQMWMYDNLILEWFMGFVAWVMVISLVLVPGAMVVRAMGQGWRGWNWRTGEGMCEAWPLRCEGNDGACGYQMIDVQDGVMCPECGLDVMVSQAIKNEKGLAVKQIGGGRLLGMLMHWGLAESSRGSVLKPRRDGIGMDVGRPEAGGGWVLFGNMVRGALLMVLIVYGILGVVVGVTGDGPNDIGDFVEGLVMVPAMVLIGGSFVGWALFGVLQCYVFVVSLLIRLGGGENQLYVMQRLMSRQSLLATLGVPTCAGVATMGLFMTSYPSGASSVQMFGQSLLGLSGFMLLGLAIFQMVILVLGVRGVRKV